jgi:Zn-dependent protease with chaperone function
MKPLITLTLGCILLFASARAQTQAFSPVAEDQPLLTSLCAKYKKNYQEEVDKLPVKNRKDLLDLYTERWKNVQEKFDKEEIYTSPFAQGYLDAMVAEVRRSNPQLRDRSFTCYFSRSWIPNASYIGEGIILFNMGLFQRLNNESEVAFVLCHEIAHFLLQHTEKAIVRYVDAINSADVQTELRKIKDSEYRKRERVDQLVKGLTFDSRRHSRDHESEADSLGLELLRHTRFDPTGALSAMALLDVIDRDTLDTEGCLKKIFNSVNYPFRKKWIARGNGLLGSHAEMQRSDREEDSLKTHPDCPLRIKLLTALMGKGGQEGQGGTALIGKDKQGGTLPIGKDGQAGTPAFAVDREKFENLKAVCRYEAIEWAYASNLYTRALYLGLDLLQADPSDPYLVAQVGRAMNGLYAAQKDHRLSKVVDLPGPGYSPNYNTLLQFIQNLYLEDIAGISYNYLSGFHPQMDDYAAFKSAYTQSAQIAK